MSEPTIEPMLVSLTRLVKAIHPGRRVSIAIEYTAAVFLAGPKFLVRVVADADDLPELASGADSLSAAIAFTSEKAIAIVRARSEQARREAEELLETAGIK